ncbi:transposase [Spirosoma foliorum]|uniref:transposase n=1 Tax=Spirosoma foliorum TaxID=2710596 RepID=UPI0021115EEB|nr:transposase [Spirosoma foliorum]
MRSGNRSGKTRISKKGNSRIRRILHMPSFNAVRFGEPTCQALYERVFQKTNTKMKAYVVVQKKLLLLAYAVWRHQTKYDPMHSVQPETDSLLTSKPGQDSKKIVPTSGTTQDQSAVVELSFG